MATVVLGAQWGDEGKGKLVDILCSKTSLCARAQGGNNAGHTIVADGVTYDFHILPSGLLNPRCMNLIGSGCVIHIPSFFKELEELEKKGLDGQGRIVMSERAQVVFDLHMLVDGLEEGELNEAAKKEAAVVNGGKAKGGEIGTTRKGIGPAYSTKVARSGVRIHHIFDKNEMDKRLRAMARGVENRYGTLGNYDVEEEIERFDVRETPHGHAAERSQEETKRMLTPFNILGLPRKTRPLRRRRRRHDARRAEKGHVHPNRRRQRPHARH